MQRTLLASLCFSLLLVPPALAESERLNIGPILQQTPVWCWAAVSEMVLKHYRFPNLNPAGNYQCGIVGSLGGSCAVNCGSCMTPIGSTYQMARVIENYQDISDAMLHRQQGQRFLASPAGRLSAREIIDEIDEGDPVVAGISPSGMGAYYPPGMSEHAVLIIGYRGSGPGVQILVNDPMPYFSMGRNPFLAVGARQTGQGQYLIDYGSFVTYLVYKDSIQFD